MMRFLASSRLGMTVRGLMRFLASLGMTKVFKER